MLEIDLRGPDGNAFALAAVAKRITKQRGGTQAAAESLAKEMLSGDYQHLLSVFRRAFCEGPAPLVRLIGASD